MSVGEFRVQDYKIRFYENLFSISPPNMFFRIGTVNEDEQIEIHIHSPLSATIRAVNGVMYLNYHEDPSYPNGQIEVNGRGEESDIPYCTGLLNGVPRRVIQVAILILNGDDEAEEYRVGGNNEQNIDPMVPLDPNTNEYPNLLATNVSEGGRGRRRRRRTQKARKRV